MTPAAGRPPVVAAEADDESPLRGRTLVDAARAAGATWAVYRMTKDLAALRSTARAAADAGLGLMVRVGDTKTILDLEEALGAQTAGVERTVPALRDRLLLVVASERTGRRVRTDARWAPSAVDLGEFTGTLLALLRRRAPNYVRAACAADDLLVPRDLLRAGRLASLAAKLGRRGARLWVTEMPPGSRAAPEDVPAHGIVIRLRA